MGSFSRPVPQHKEGSFCGMSGWCHGVLGHSGGFQTFCVSFTSSAHPKVLMVDEGRLELASGLQEELKSRLGEGFSWGSSFGQLLFQGKREAMECLAEAVRRT